MDFLCIVLFLAIYHLKPQEWSPVFSTIRFALLVMIASLATLIFRERSLRLRDFFRTPHDWAMLAFFLWVVLANDSPYGMFKDFFNRLVFYVVTVQTLTNWDRIRKYLGWWTAFIVITAALALAAEFHIFDPLGTKDLIDGTMKGRLVLNLSMVNNPNALGHTLVPVIAMLYYFAIWKRPIFMQQIGLVAMAIPLAAIYLTESKGAYIIGAITIVATLTFGRAKTVQIIIGSVLIFAVSATIYLLPRMGELQKATSDEAIQGRMKAFTYGIGYYEHLERGIGQGKFVRRLLTDHHYYKAPHSTYVQTGAELGFGGMFTFLLVMWCNFRTLLFAETRTPDEERIRRILFVLALTYAASGWMVDFAYRPTFFMFTAAIAAFHRHLYRIVEEVPDEEPDYRPAVPAWRARLLAEPAPAGAPVQVAMQMLPAPLPTSGGTATLQRANFPWEKREPETVAELDTEQDEKPTFWNRIGWLDIAAALLWVKVTIMFWYWVIQNYSAH